MATARSRILEGGARAFGRLGHARTRVEDVLHESGVSRPTFYKEFASADALFETLARVHFAELSQLLVDALDAVSDPGGKLLSVIDAYFRWRIELGEFGRVLDTEARDPRSVAARLRRPVSTRLVAAFEAQIVALGRPLPDPLLLHALLAAAEHLGDTLPSTRTPTDAERIRRRDVLVRLAAGALAMDGEPLPPLPKDASDDEATASFPTPTED